MRTSSPHVSLSVTNCNPTQGVACSIAQAGKKLRTAASHNDVHMTWVSLDFLCMPVLLSPPSLLYPQQCPPRTSSLGGAMDAIQPVHWEICPSYTTVERLWNLNDSPHLTVHCCPGFSALANLSKGLIESRRGRLVEARCSCPAFLSQRDSAGRPTLSLPLLDHI